MQILSKLLTVFALVLGCLLFPQFAAQAQTTSTPQNTIWEYVQAVEDKDMPVLRKIYGLENDSNSNASKKLETLAAGVSQDIANQGGIAKREIIQESISGNQATIKVQIVYGNQSKQTLEFHLIQTGKQWLLQ